MDFQWRTQYHRVTSTLPAVTGLLGLFSVLMVVFLICSQRVSMPGVPIDLPRFDNEEVTPVVKTVVTVTQEGRLFYNAKRLEGPESLHEVLRDLESRYGQGEGEGVRAAEGSRVVVFYVDQNAPLSIVAKLFDIARGANFDAYLATSGASLRDGKNRVPLDETDF